MATVHTADRDGIRIITLDNPPVNALSFAYSAELLKAVQAAEADSGIRAVIFAGANGLFSGGADVNDFSTEPTPETKTIRDVIAAIEAGKKTYVAAIDGTCMGGGLELSLACDYRICTTRSKLGLPEIKLGLLPGAGGTQRLPRLIGAQDALQMMLKGETVRGEDAKKKRIVDEVVADNVVDAAIGLASKHVDSAPKRRVSEMKVELGAGMQAFAVPFVVASAHKMVPPEDNGGFAAHKLIDAVEGAFELPFARGLAREARLFEELVRSAPSAALRHVFFAERDLGKVPGLQATTPLEVKKAGVVGGGLMGTGIAITFANAGIPVTVIEPSDEATEKGKQMVFGMYMHQVQKGRMSQEEAWAKGQSVQYTDDYNELKDCDVIIEAVFENMDVKKQVFQKVDAIAKPSAILASNTSTLDIDEMALVTKRPQQFVGLHFFAPANIMQLLEIVRGKDTDAQTLSTAIALGKTLRKKGVISANKFGFIGNRMLFDYAREAMALAEEGVPPYRIDDVMKNAFGFAMGPFAMFDLSGLDVFWHIQQARPDTKGRSNIVDRMYQEKRIGQKSGKGFYKYEKGKREPIRDEEAEALIAEEAKKAGIGPREATDQEIIKRLSYALANVGADLLEHGVALRAGDIDIVYVYGYGFPPHHGGPMWYADEVGVKNVYDDIVRFQQTFGDQWKPAPLLEKLAKSGGTFAAYKHETKELAHA